jgi:hypothetical protein
MKRIAILVSTLLIATLAAAAPALAAAPSNDVIGGAIAVSDGYNATLDTTQATTDANDAELNAQCGAPKTDASVWYTLTAAADGFFAVDVSGSNYSAGVIVASGSPGSFVVESCGPGATAFAATSGVTYSILAFDDQGDGAGNGGNLVINVAAIPPPPQVTLTVNKTGRFNSKTGTATISGTITCTGGPADFTEIDVSVRQTVGRIFIDGFGAIGGFTCDGTLQKWSTEVFGFNGLFKGGKALTVTFAIACGPFLCGVDFNQRVVQLKGR